MAKKGFKLKGGPTALKGREGATMDVPPHLEQHRTQRAPGTTDGIGRRRNHRNNTQNKLTSGDYKARNMRTGDVSEYAATNRTVSRGRASNSNHGEEAKLFSNGETSYKTISLHGPGAIPGTTTPSQHMISS